MFTGESAEAFFAKVVFADADEKWSGKLVTTANRLFNELLAVPSIYEVIRKAAPNANDGLAEFLCAFV